MRHRSAARVNELELLADDAPARDQMNRFASPLSIALFVVSLALFLACLGFPGYRTDWGDGPIGLQILLTGWGDILMPGFNWWANPLMLLGWVFLFLIPRYAFRLAITATIVMALFLLRTNVLSGSGDPTPIRGRPLGYWLWLGSGMLRQALQRTAILSNEKYRGTRLTARPDLLTIQAHNPEQEEAEDQVEVSYQGEEVEIGFNERF